MALIWEGDLLDEGMALFTAPATIYEVALFALNGQNIQYRSTLDPRRIMHAGWVALAYGAGGEIGFPTGRIRWHKYFEFERESLVIHPALYCDAVYWYVPLSGANYASIYGD